MYVVLPHHKTEEWGDRPIRAVVPFELALITWLYVTHAHPVLYLGDDGRDRTPYLFMRWSKKQECFLPLEDSHLTGEWHRLNAACPWPAFPPVMLRHIHVEDRVQHLADMVRAGGSAADLRGDAVLMANTVGPVWEKHYLSGKAYNKLVNTALDAKTKWRREQLALIRPELDDMVTALDAAAVQAAVGGGAAAGGPSGQSEAMLLEEDGDC